MSARTVILAVEEPAAARLVPGLCMPESQRSVSCVYFGCSAAPVQSPMLVLNGTGSGPVNNLCVPSLVSPRYAPAGRHLVSATVVGENVGATASLETRVVNQMREWFGSQVEDWQHLRTYHISYALPDQSPGRQHSRGRTGRFRGELIICGDYREHGSIQGAMQSGRRAAELVSEPPITA